MEIVKIILLVVAAFVSLAWAYGVRTYVRSGQGITKQTVNTTMLFFVSIFLVIFLKISSLNLLWMFPVSWLLGTLSLAFPFSLLWLLGKWFARIFCIGLDWKEVERKSKKVDKAREYLIQGMSVEEIKEKLKNE